MRYRVGEDGILHLDVPVGLTDAELEVTITLKKVTPVTITSEELEWKEFIERTYGSCADDPIVIDNKGISAALDDNLEMIFE
ncbi:hypothetical protein [Microseira wollei]|uniref:Uncharacterized protein n=1 Tax=Microseira wollei NIES-4236 TaxID=2530354 RepID=A0AAV3XE26_9CYAN|nr:hypothetical protein [Microseira wollei]GET38617.1 hypothetical protein MiSe_33750 [Microseira wollei NIES-4236]